ncbi:MAG: hypothetical protein ABFD00_10525 [Chloroherpetonaceae bacterium]
MKLRTYLADQEITFKAFAEILGVHKNYISAIACGRTLPGKRLKRDIDTLTEGKVVLRLKEKKK